MIDEADTFTKDMWDTLYEEKLEKAKEYLDTNYVLHKEYVMNPKHSLKEYLTYQVI